MRSVRLHRSLSKAEMLSLRATGSPQEETFQPDSAPRHFSNEVLGTASSGYLRL